MNPSRRLPAVAMILAFALVVLGFSSSSPMVPHGTSGNAVTASTLTGMATPVKGVAAIPRSAAQGVTIGTNQNAFRVALPNAAQAPTGATSPNGVTIYHSSDHADNAVVPTRDGAQFLQVIHSWSAPTAFSYRISVPRGGRLLVPTSGPNGSTSSAPAAFILNAAGAMVGSVSYPWAHDARGRAISTYFTASGSTLTQHVLHRQSGLTYPVTADPNFRWYKLGVVVTLTYSDMVAVAGGGIYAAEGLMGASLPTGFGIIPASVISGMLTTIAAGAAWGVAAHECLWFWFPYPGVWDVPGQGYYPCS